jgi:dihydrolipoamide dehydrogenase
MRNAGAGRRPRRLFRRVPRRRPRHEDRDRRTLCDAGRRLPQRRLHSVEGAAACRRGDGRGRACADLGVSFAAPKVDIDKLRAHKEKVVGKLTGGLAGMAKARKVETVRGYGHFLDANHLEVEETTGTRKEKTGAKKVIRFQKCIIAAGSAAFHLPFIPKDPRIVDSTGALELRFVPKRMLVIGGGIIGLEMATVYSTLGAKVDVVEMLDGLMQGPDRDLVKVWEKQNAKRFDKVMLKTKTVAVEAKPTASGSSSKASRRRPRRSALRHDPAIGRRAPNGKKIGAEKAGVAVNERGFIPVDSQMRTNVPHIFAIGDIVGNPCWRTRRCTRPTSRPKPPPGRRPTSTPR